MLRLQTSRHADGSYKDGAFCFIQDKSHNQDGKELVMVETHQGCVIDEFERNGYNDSDFFAVVWDFTQGCPTNIQFATTRAWTYSNTCIVDATEEVKQLYRIWKEKTKLVWKEYDEQCKPFIPSKGQTAKSLTTKGQAKGLSGTIFWVGDSFGGKSVGIKDESTGRKGFVSVDRIQLWHPIQEKWVNPASYSNTFAKWFVSESDVSKPKRVSVQSITD